MGIHPVLRTWEAWPLSRRTAKQSQASAGERSRAEQEPAWTQGPGYIDCQPGEKANDVWHGAASLGAADGAAIRGSGIVPAVSRAPREDEAQEDEDQEEGIPPYHHLRLCKWDGGNGGHVSEPACLGTMWFHHPQTRCRIRTARRPPSIETGSKIEEPIARVGRAASLFECRYIVSRF